MRKRAELKWAEDPEESTDDDINKLSNLSSKLNEKSDKLNSAISAVNTKLGKLRLGIEVWLENPPLELGEQHHLTDFDGRPLGGYRRVKLLGYARTGRKWQLAVKQAAINTETGKLVHDVEGLDPVSPWPLLDASRQVRSDAMFLVPDLIALLNARGESLVKAIEAAEKTAEQL